MKVVLKKPIPELGNKGEVCVVADGYARNYLIPRGFAEPATTEVLQLAGKEKVEKEKAAEQDLAHVESIASALEGQSVEFLVKASEEGRLYAAITPQKISTKLKKNGFPIDQKQIILSGALKELGDHEVLVRFPHGLEARIIVVVGEEL